MKKENIRFLNLSILISVLFSFTACLNFTGDVSKSQPAASSEVENQNKGKGTFTGIITMNGASPFTLQELAEKSADSKRSALPEITGEFTRYATATKGTDVKPITMADDGNSFSVSLENGTWTIETGIKKSDHIIMMDKYRVTISDDNPAVTHKFVLKAYTESGATGSIKLEMKIPTSVGFVSVECTSTNKTAWSDELKTAPITGTYAERKATLQGTALPAGNYVVELKFLDKENGVILYRLPNFCICVIGTFETNKWGENTSDGVIENGLFTLNTEKLEEFERTQVYVSAAHGDDTTANGSRYSPYKTLQNAVNKIAKQGDSQKDYTLLIDGEITGKNCMAELPDSLNLRAKTITIRGLNGNTTDKLNATQQGRVLKISTSVPVTIQDLTITGGKVGVDSDGNKIKKVSLEAGAGGGIYIANGTTVTLENGAIIGNNSSSITTAADNASYANYAVYGGGIYCEGTLNLKNGSKVTYNYIDDAVSNNTNLDDYSLIGTGGGGICCNEGTVNIENGAVISYNGANARGAGIGLRKASLTMTGGEISHNISNCWGGGIAVGNKDINKKLEISGGKISDNEASTYHGGGIFYEPTGTDTGDFIISDNAEIKNNKAGVNGGGICILNAVLKMSGGIISNNTAANGGAIAITVDTSTDPYFYMSGSAYIPYGVTINGTATTGAGKNDVYLGSGRTVTLVDNLSSSSNTSTNQVYITPVLKRGTNLLSKTDSLTAITDEIAAKFALTTSDLASDNYDDSWEKIISSSAVSINSPFYVAPAGTGDDNNSGTKTSPYLTIEKACQQCDDNTVDFYIYIQGTLTDPQTIPSTLSTAESGTYKAKSITLVGATGLNAGGYPQDNLKNANGVSLTVNGAASASNTVPIIIEKLWIDGKTGIDVKQNAKLTLYNGTYVACSEYAAKIAYNAADFTLDGTVRIPTSSGSTVNKLYLEKNGNSLTKVNIGSTLNKLSTDNYPSKIIFLENPAKGLAVLSGDTTKFSKIEVYENLFSTDSLGSFSVNDNDGTLLLRNNITKLYVEPANTQAWDPAGLGPDADDDGTPDGIDPTTAAAWANMNYYADSNTQGNWSKRKPFKTLKAALQYITWQANKDNEYAIFIEGTVTGAQTLPANDTTNHITLDKTSTVKKISIYGKYGGSSDVLAGGFAKGSGDNPDKIGTTLTITTSVPIVFGDSYGIEAGMLEISGGYQPQGNGGGIYINSADADVTLKGNVTVKGQANKGGAIYNKGTLTIAGATIRDGYALVSGTGNNACAYGGGIYNEKIVNMSSGYIRYCKAGIETNDTKGDGACVYSTGANAVFNMTGGAIDNGNVAKNRGGGIYLDSGSKLYMSGSACIGKLNPEGVANYSSRDCEAATGGGLYVGAGCHAYLGFLNDANTTNVGTEFTGGIKHNYASKCAGGIYIDVGLNNPGEVTMSGGKISHNGAGENANDATAYGGGVVTTLAGGTKSVFTMTGGEVSDNQASSKGGGVYNVGKFSMQGGCLKSNTLQSSPTTKQGGAVWVGTNGPAFEMSGEATIPDGSLNVNDVFLERSGSYNNYSTARVTITDALTGTAAITPQQLADTCVWLQEGSTGLVAANYTQFSVTTSGKYLTGKGKIIDVKTIGAYGSTAPTANQLNPVTVAVCTQNDLTQLGAWLEAGTDLTYFNVKLYDDFTIDNTYTGIGSSAKQFTGSMDGQKHTVTFSSATNGIFNYTQNAQISNIILAGSLSPTGTMGPVVAHCVGGKVSNCVSSVTINTAYSGDFGGIAGESEGTEDGGKGDGNQSTHNRDCKFLDCRFSGTLTCSGSAGGIVGSPSVTLMQNCTNSGTIKTTANYGSCGGIAGFTAGAGGDGHGCEIVNCYNSGTINGRKQAGGLAGGHTSGNTDWKLKIVTSCSTGTISGNKIGGLVGHESGWTTCQQCKYTTPDNACGSGSNPSGAAKITSLSSALSDLNVLYSQNPDEFRQWTSSGLNYPN